MTAQPFKPQFMKLTPREVRGEDPDKAIEDRLQFPLEMEW
jgi:hypothetical protein